jgi:hypothetical protein
MAEVWASLTNARLKLRDPTGAISFLSVATLPTVGLGQTAYRLSTDGLWYQYNSVSASWKVCTLNISDSTLNTLIDKYGADDAVIHAIPFIIAGIIDTMRIVKMDSGTESTQFQTLSDMLSFYKGLKTLYEEEIADTNGYSTGRFIRSCKPSIGGVDEW